jgi:acyl carrier protein phosphodiesterase
MNYLAHAYLSFEQDEILLGNLISDFVKGKQKFIYPPRIQMGIQLHRDIDGYTDVHPVTKEAKKIFQPVYRLYSGAFIDVVFDHFLAKKLSGRLNLKSFAETVYDKMEKQVLYFPPGFPMLFASMKKHNWLYHYQYTEGIVKSFGGLQRRAAYITETDSAIGLFEKHYGELQDFFDRFWDGLHLFAYNKYKSLPINF